MSVCHSSLGAARSNRRCGGVGFLRAFGAGNAAKPADFNCRRTVSGLAFRKNSRRSICEMRRTPCVGLERLSETIFALTGSGSLLTVRAPYGFGLSPASPPSRYARTHSKTVPCPTPISFATNSPGSPSSR